ncbi:MAG: serine hydrolase, partial [Dehalococcoidia bacterium]|nr:serine hydrolase [Dehalococcoidia bacterium]
PDVHGDCDPRFEAVRRAFAENFAERGDVGAAVAVTLDGEPVVDLWGGWLDKGRTRPWQRDSLGAVWSLGKALTAISVLRLVERGALDLEAPVARYWPEFAQGGKERVTVRHLLTHQAGLVAIRKPLPPGANLLSWDTMVEALAEQAPWWEPGTAHGYHVNTIGFLLGEVMRRVDGRKPGGYIREEVAGPLGVEFHIGVAVEDDERCADWIGYRPPPGEVVESQRPWLDRDPATLDGIDLARVLAYRNPPGLPWRNTPEGERAWRAAEFPSTNPYSNARSLARIFGALACGGSVGGAALLRPETIERATQVESFGTDLVLGRPTRFGLGFMLTFPERAMGPGERTFGHYGNGAVVALADPERRLGFAFVCNQAGRSWRDPRSNVLLEALYGALGAYT